MSAWTAFAQVLAVGFGSGLAPFAPGTCGTLVGVLVYLALARLPAPAYLLVVAVLFAAGVPVCAARARRLGVHDHPSIVWDEIVGYLIAMILAPRGWPWVAGGFLAFRFFDIAKPWPVRWADRRVGGGWGIMLDDLLAGVYAFALLQIVGLALKTQGELPL